ncbi:hypothetical protein F5876DRAFT_80505 [Lentinula aff. lateritia]|uniref:Uncharacterized protein n=1 Tax=Lentinula aff. lateritia TaxID=2804960 RepID=A0ACC1TPQ1_9AGAR|nr:hypothetical protein F5876DRAFT_80505 [Lentinula aff. lateritia]
MEVPRVIKKGTSKQRVEAGDPDDGDDRSNGEDDEDDEEEKAPLATKQEGAANPTGERIAVLESQMAQLLANNQQLWDGQIRTDMYQCHLLKKINWIMMDAARRGKSPPVALIAGHLELPKKRRRVVDSDEEEVEGGGEDRGEEEEEEGEVEKLAPKKARLCHALTDFPLAQSS